MSWIGLLVVPLVTGVLAGENDIAREVGYGDTYGSDAPAYGVPGYGSYGPDNRWQIGASSPFPGESGSSSVRPLLLGLLIGALVKIPLLLLGKLILVKFAVPLAVIGALIPLGALAIYRAVAAQQSGPAGNSTARILPQQCIQAAACAIGSVAPKAAVVSTSWLLKTITDSREKAWDSRTDILVYRDAYMKGATTKNCQEYPCPFF